MFRFIQVILLRLSRVTYLSLHKYLGLTKELVEKVSLSELPFFCYVSRVTENYLNLLHLLTYRLSFHFISVMHLSFSSN
jgi:hypothetical protein